MVFYIFTFIVFIAELIIGTTLLLYLVKLSKELKKYNSLVEAVKPNLKDLLKTVRQISEQMLKFAPLLKEQLKSAFMNIVVGQVKNTLGAATFWLVKREVEKHAG